MIIIADSKQVIQCLAILKANYRTSFSNMSKQEANTLADLWISMFADTPAEELQYAVRYFITTSTSAFAPTIGQINDVIQKHYHPLTPLMEAWSIVRKALRNSSDYKSAKAEWEKFPEDVKATLKPEDLTRLGQMDITAVDSTIAAMFRKSLEQNQQRIKAEKAVPESVKGLLPSKQLELGPKHE